MQDIDAKTVALAQELIRVDTVDPPGNERAAAEFVAKVLADAGIRAELIDIGPGRANLLARVKGSGERKSLVYSAHFDTIPADPAEWSRSPFGGEVAEGKLHGRGATDMKAGMAAMVMAAVALKRANAPLKGDLVLALTAAENSNCLGAEAFVRGGRLRDAGALLISEPSSLDVFVAEKGALWLRATATGDYGHNAFSESRTGDRGNAILRMAEFLSRVRDLEIEAPPHRHLGPPTINVGLIDGGVSRPIIAHRCTADIDVRTVPGLKPAAVLAQFRGIAGRHVTVEQTGFKPPVDTPDDDPFVKLCLDVTGEVRGRSVRPAGVGYYSDGTVLAPALGIPLVIIGPGETGMSGAVDEHCDLGKLALASRIYEKIAHRALS
ncbi:MAG: M20 family metallopeptidase [Hyphomicrobiaceae bacterium]